MLNEKTIITTEQGSSSNSK